MIGSLLVVLAACSDDGSSSSAVDGPTPSPTATGDTSTSAPNFAACRDVTRGGDLIESITLPGTAPEAFGGTLTPGLYDLVELSIYSGAPPDPTQGEPTIYPMGAEKAQVTIEVADGAIRMATGTGNVGDTGFASEQLSTGWIKADGTQITYDGICPTRDKAVMPYSVVGQSLVLYTRPDRIETYRKR